LESKYFNTILGFHGSGGFGYGLLCYDTMQCDGVVSSVLEQLSTSAIRIEVKTVAAVSSY
jgi:hypothetical protein